MLVTVNVPLDQISAVDTYDLKMMTQIARAKLPFKRLLCTPKGNVLTTIYEDKITINWEDNYEAHNN